LQSIAKDKVPLLIAAVVRGKRNNQIAKELGVSPSTITHARKDPEIKAQIEAAQREIVASARALARSKSRDAVIVLAKEMKHADKAADRIKAAVSLLDLFGVGEAAFSVADPAENAPDTTPLDRDTLVASLAALPPDVLTDALAKAGG
jgi:hypothetical protein